MLPLLLVCAALVIAVVVFLLYYYKHKKNAEEMNRKVINLESIIEQANDAMLVIDIENGKILNCNPSAAGMLGYSHVVLQNKTLFDIQPREMLNKSASVIADVWENKGMIFKDIPFVHQNGERIDVECSAKVAPYAGRPSVVIYARDIRERLRLEKEVSMQSEIIAHKNKDILDSINYAKRIQQSVLPDEKVLADHFNDYFIVYKPKDIVSGDFYFAEHIRTNDGHTLVGIAVADCTGHGVPGAFMSLLGAGILHQSLTESTVNSSADALNYLNHRLNLILKQKDSEAIRDGMDISFCVYDKTSSRVYYAGANNDVYLVRDGLITKFDADKQPIGFYENQKPFSLKTIEVKPNDMLFLYTDGYPDQFGGPRGKKLKYSRMEETLTANASESCTVQKQRLLNFFAEWKGDLEQLDDVTIIGLRI